MKVGIIGLGLMGGSLGLALQDTKIVSQVLGYSRNLKTCEEALELGLVHEIASFDEIKACDMIFLAIPVEAIIDTLQLLEEIADTTTVIDLGSTKEKIVQSVPKSIRKNFIAAHPMCGTEKFGPSAAFKTLYQNQVVVFCDTQDSANFHKDKATQIFSHIGMKIVFMDAASHDKRVSLISHMPHVLSYSIANGVIGQEDPKSILLLAGGGFRDMSRLAKSSPAMWSDIFKQNKKNLLNALDIFQEELDKAKEMVKEDKWEELEEWMANATTLHKIL
jgi:prephenate dehydrogenase